MPEGFFERSIFITPEGEPIQIRKLNERVSRLEVWQSWLKGAWAVVTAWLSGLESCDEVRRPEALFPSLKRRGGCAIKKISRSNLSSRRRGGQIGEILRPEEFRRTDHPVCGASEASRLFLMPQPPLLFKEGNVSALKQSVNWLAVGVSAPE